MEQHYPSNRRFLIGGNSISPVGAEALPDLPMIRRSRLSDKPFWNLQGGGFHTFPSRHYHHVILDIYITSPFFFWIVYSLIYHNWDFYLVNDNFFYVLICTDIFYDFMVSALDLY